MTTVLGILVLGGFLAAYLAYARWLESGMQPRSFSTSLDEHALRELFADRVARAGWKVVDDGNPMVAQSSMLSGIRQQIYLRLAEHDGGLRVTTGPSRWVTSWGVPKKAHTIRMRLNSFVSAVQSRDAAIVVTKQPLKS